MVSAELREIISCGDCTERECDGISCLRSKVSKLEDELERLKLYESEHERLKSELNRILHPNGDGPKAPSFCDLVAYVESDFRKLKDHNQALQENLEPMIEEQLKRARSQVARVKRAAKALWSFAGGEPFKVVVLREDMVEAVARTILDAADGVEEEDKKLCLCTFKGDEHACPHFCGPFGMPFLDPCQNQHNDVCVYDVPAQIVDEEDEAQ